MWKLIPVETGGTPTTPQPPVPDSPPLYGGDTAGQPYACTQHTRESERDDLGTIVTEVTTTTVTTRKRYRVEDA